MLKIFFSGLFLLIEMSELYGYNQCPIPHYSFPTKLNKMITITEHNDIVKFDGFCSLREAINKINGKISDCKITYNQCPEHKGYFIKMNGGHYILDHNLKINAIMDVIEIDGMDSTILSGPDFSDLNLIELYSSPLYFKNLSLKNITIQYFKTSYNEGNFQTTSALKITGYSFDLNNVTMIGNSLGSKLNSSPLYFDGKSLILNQFKFINNYGNISLDLGNQGSSSYVNFDKSIIFQNSNLADLDNGVVKINYLNQSDIVEINNSTIASNENLYGIQTFGETGRLDIKHSTIVYNDLNGIFNGGDVFLTIYNSIISNNTTNPDFNDIISSSENSINLRYSIIGSLNTISALTYGISEETNFINVDPQLIPNFSSIYEPIYYIPSLGSVAIDRAPCLYEFSTDQRDKSRPIIIFTNIEYPCDIGSIEVQWNDEIY